jgi:hypothetical protein
MCTSDQQTSPLLNLCLPVSPPTLRCVLLSLPSPSCPLLPSVSVVCLNVRHACLIMFIATISITSPSSSSYWFVTSSVHCLALLTSLFLLSRVQNVSNVIDWTYNSGDPNPVDIIVTNGNNQTLNGDFSIAQFVQVSDQVCLARGTCTFRDLICDYSRSP